MINPVLNVSRMLSSIVTRRCSSHSPMKGNANSYAPNNLERRFLVWTGKYKNLEEVPNLVSTDVMERSRNKMRIRISNIMMVLTAIGCVVMVYSGKQAAKSGESVTKQNFEWHKKYNELHSEDANAEIMERCRNKVRIRLANTMMFLTVVGCILMVYIGKEAAKRGETVAKQNIEWHKRYNELHGGEEKKE